MSPLDRVAAIAGAANCHPAGDDPTTVTTHLVDDAGVRICDRRPMRDPVLADVEVPRCRRCRARAARALELLEAESSSR